MTSPRPFSTLRQFVRSKASLERCGFCAADLDAHHQHTFEPAARQLRCVCDPCAILFSNRANGKYIRVPRRVRLLAGFQLTDAQWDSLYVPIGLAFFTESTPAGRVIAIYPSPAGPTESLLSLESWQAIADQNPGLREMEPDVEALLVNRVSPSRGYYLVPIDRCYELVGLIRTHWRGLSGGAQVWSEIERFFGCLNRDANA